MIPSSTSSYRIVATVNKFEAQRLNCQQDLVSGTHLMTPDLPAEAAGISAVLPAAQSFYVGVIQARDQAKTDIGWTLLTGEPVLEALWGTDQPIDGPSSHYFEDNEANVAELRTGTANGLLYDARGDLAQAAICECDGKATPQQ